MAWHCCVVADTIGGSRPCANRRAVVSCAKARRKRHPFHRSQSPCHPSRTPRRFVHYKLSDIPVYDLSKYPFVLYVPKAPSPTGQYGILYDIVAQDTDKTPATLHGMADDMHLILVVCHNNKLTEWQRAALAMDAAFNLQQGAPIDPRRVYLMGYAHINSIALETPDVFTGNISVLGTSFYRTIYQLTGGTHYERYMAKDAHPAHDLLELDKQRPQVRAMSTGEPINSFRGLINRDMKREGFKYIYSPYISDEDAAWASPSPDWIEKSIQFMDAANGGNLAQETPAAPQPVQTKLPKAQAMLEEAETYKENGLNDFARDKLNGLIEQYPSDVAATKAKEILKQMDAQEAKDAKNAEENQ